jgi:hypothetical protein
VSDHYCLDTSTLIEAWSRSYPYDLFPRLWGHLSKAAGAGVVMCPDEVATELERKEDGLYKWAKAQTSLFVPLDAPQQMAVSEILARFPRLVDTRKNRNQADPFVIGLARVRNCSVVTQEMKTGNSDKPKIPDVCEHFKVRTLKLLELIRESAWDVG